MQSATRQATQEVGPERLCLRRHDRYAKDFVHAVGIEATAIITATETTRPAWRDFT